MSTTISRDYELMTILLPDLEAEAQAAAIEKLNGHITGAGAEITETLTDSPWGRRRIAYSIRKEGVDYRDGFYVVSHFSSSPENIGELERELRLDPAVIRYLLVMDDPKAGSGDQEEAEEAGEAAADEATEAVAPEATTAAEAAPAEESAAEAEEVAEAAEDTAEVAAEAADDAEEAASEDEETPSEA